MKNLNEELQKFSQPCSSVKHSQKIVRKFTRVDIERLNAEISPKIKENAYERKASWEEARKIIVKG